MKMKTLVDALPALQKLANQDLTINTLYEVSKLLKRLDDEISIYNKARRQLIEKYCDISDGKAIPKAKTESEFLEKFEELLNFEIEIDNSKPVKIPITEKISFSYKDLSLISQFVVIEKE